MPCDRVDGKSELEGHHPEVRRARLSEAPAIADLWLRSRYASVPHIPAPTHPDAEVRTWFATTVLPSQDVWVIELGGEVVALMVLADDWVEQLYVDPRFTGRGLGSRLLGVAMRDRGSLELWTFQANAGARRFYERHGFVAVGATAGDNEEGAPDVHYRWRNDLPG